MRGLFVIGTLVLFASPGWAQGTGPKWVKASGKDAQTGLTICVDQTSIVKSADGRVQFANALCEMTAEQMSDSDMAVTEVNCNENMSGKTVTMKELPYRRDGVYNWAQRKEINPSGTSLSAQAARFVCHK